MPTSKGIKIPKVKDFWTNNHTTKCNQIETFPLLLKLAKKYPKIKDFKVLISLISLVRGLVNSSFVNERDYYRLSGTRIEDVYLISWPIVYTIRTKLIPRDIGLTFIRCLHALWIKKVQSRVIDDMINKTWENYTRS